MRALEPFGAGQSGPYSMWASGRIGSLAMTRLMHAIGLGLVLWGGAILAVVEALSRREDDPKPRAQVYDLGAYRRGRDAA